MPPSRHPAANGGNMEAIAETAAPAPISSANGQATHPATSPATPLFFKLGQPYPEHGGVYAGIVRAPAGQNDWHLFVPTDPAAEFAALAWGGHGHREESADDKNDGLANTIALVAAAHAHPAAEACRAVVIGEHADFYLPAQCELAICFANVRELFEKTWYWSSTQYAGNHSYAWGQGFVSGSQGSNGKDYEGRCRAVRRLVIQ